MPRRSIIRLILIAAAASVPGILGSALFLGGAFPLFFLGNLVVQVAAIVVSIVAGLSSNRLYRKIRRLESSKDTSESASTDATGWVPLRNPHYVRGMAALITSVLLPLMWAGLIAAGVYAQESACGTYGSGTTECGGMQWLGVAILIYMFLAGVVVLTPITYMLGRDVLRMAGAVYDWPARPAYDTHPALKFAQTLRQTQFILIWCWLVLAVWQFMR